MKFQVTVPVAAPASTLWAAVVDPLAWPRFTESMDSVAWERGDSVAVGSRARVVQPRLGANLWEVTAVAPGRSFTWRNARPGVTSLATHEVRQTGPGASELTLGFDQSGPLAWLVGLLAGSRSHHYVELEASGVKRAAESQAS